MPDLRFVLIEDEAAAASRLRKMVQELRSNAQCVHTVDTVEEALEWLPANAAQYDLLFMDVQLADGISFEIFEEIKVEKPVIFTTAYDGYALQAFRVNGLDYLLKPVKVEELEQALAKCERLQAATPPAIDYTRLAAALRQPFQEQPQPVSQPALIESGKTYQKRLLVKIGETLKALEIAEAAYFYAQDKVIFMRHQNGRDYPLDHNLDQLEALLDPLQFFRINRQYIINIKAIQSMHAWSKSRIKLLLSPPAPAETVVSSYRTGEFKAWLEAK